MKHFILTLVVLCGATALLPTVDVPPIGGRSCHVDADCRPGETCQQRGGVWQCIETKGSEP